MCAAGVGPRPFPDPHRPEKLLESSSTVVDHTRSQTLRGIQAHRLIEADPLEPAADEERRRLFVGTHTLTRCPHTLTHTQTYREQLLIFAATAVVCDNMCFVPCVRLCKFACVHAQIHTHVFEQMPIIFQVSVLFKYFFFRGGGGDFKKRKLC